MLQPRPARVAPAPFSPRAAGGQRGSTQLRVRRWKTTARGRPRVAARARLRTGCSAVYSGALLGSAKLSRTSVRTQFDFYTVNFLSKSYFGLEVCAALLDESSAHRRFAVDVKREQGSGEGWVALRCERRQCGKRVTLSTA